MKRRLNIVWKALFLAFLIIGTVYIIVDAHHAAPYQKDSGTIFGTMYHITYQHREDLQAGIEDALHRVDNSLSTFNNKSTLSRINDNSSTTTDKMFTEVFQLAEQVSGQTGGAFDITVAPLVNAWGFGFKNKTNVTPQLIDSLRKYVGYQKVHLKDGHLIKDDPHIMLDCSGIAKGYGCDVVANYLESKGIENYMVEIGGEIRAKGKNEKQEVWHIGIAKPKDDSQNYQNGIESVLALSDVSLATSGNYRNFYYKNGKKYAHTIDPHTGYPVQHSILSSTVLAPTCGEADAYATAFMVLGLDKAKAVLARHPELKAFFIYSDAKRKDAIWCSKALEADIMK